VPRENEIRHAARFTFLKLKSKIIMNDVIITGIGQTKVGEHWDISLRELGFYAMEAAQTNAGGIEPQALFVGNAMAPNISGQAHLGVLLADFAGLRGIEAYAIEAGGATGGAALRAGYLAVKSGFVDVAMVVGVEKITDTGSDELETTLTTMLDSDYEAIQGLTMTAQGALLMRRYLHEYQVPRAAFAGFPLIAHANGAGNPYAMFQRAIKPALYERAGMVADPLNMFDVAPDADGAAAVVLTRDGLQPPDLPHPVVRIAGSSTTTDTLAIHDRPAPLDFRAARLSVERAIYQAGITIDQIEFFELFDYTSIHAALSLEAAGFAGPGHGWKLAQNESIASNGPLPISTLGGLKARGNPWGATGVYQAVEAVLQLRGQAGDNQVVSPKFGMIQCLGGTAATAVTHILEVVG
jgi:acetyl-CoA C-acetyltransferase